MCYDGVVGSLNASGVLLVSNRAGKKGYQSRHTLRVIFMCTKCINLCSTTFFLRPPLHVLFRHGCVRYVQHSHDALTLLLGVQEPRAFSATVSVADTPRLTKTSWGIDTNVAGRLRRIGINNIEQ